MRLPLASIALLGSATAFSTHSRSSWSPSFTSTSTSSALSASGGRLHVRPIGIGSCAPQTILTNFDLESVHDTSDEWIKSRTGIEQRHVLVHEGTKNVAHVAKLTGNPVKDDANGDAEEEGGAVMVAVDGGQGQVQPETLRTLGIDAARNALAMSGLTGADIDLVICATSSPDDLFGDAPSIADAVGCDKGKVMAFDLTAACSGFLFGIVTAGQFLQNSHGSGGSMKNALVLGADALTRWVDWDDRNSCILFGDGAGAMVLTSESSSSSTSTDDDDGKKEEDSENDGFGILGYAAHSNGAGYNDLKCIYRGEPKKITTPGEGTTVHDGSYDLMTMNGRKVYSFATREVPNVLEEAMDNAGITVDQVDWLLLHQANIRIMEVVAERLGMPMDKVITNLYKYGNTSAASIPLALDEAVRSGKVKKGDVIACAGFGAGLSWGAAILKWG